MESMLQHWANASVLPGKAGIQRAWVQTHPPLDPGQGLRRIAPLSCPTAWALAARPSGAQVRPPQARRLGLRFTLGRPPGLAGGLPMVFVDWTSFALLRENFRRVRPRSIRALRLPEDDMPGRHHLLDVRQHRRHHFWVIVELQHKRQVYDHPQQVVSVHFAPAAEPSDATEHGDAVHFMLVVQQLEDFLHKAVVFDLVTFLDVDTHDGDCFHTVTPRLRDR
uniref:Uncharacterized protein n=1 Tax=mine drainage metagenome TaxID=410659 RepID=E6PP80_9ZZZZ